MLIPYRQHLIWIYANTDIGNLILNIAKTMRHACGYDYNISNRDGLGFAVSHYATPTWPNQLQNRHIVRWKLSACRLFLISPGD